MPTPIPTPNPDPNPTRPFILVVCHALTGHLAPLLRITGALHAQLTDSTTIFFLGPTAHRHRIEATGATFLPLLDDADLDDRAYYAHPPHPADQNYSSLHWSDRVLIDLRAQCLDPLPTQWTCFTSALRTLHSRGPSRGVLVLAEAFFYGILPLFHRAPLPPDIPSPIGTLCVSVTIPAIRSVDLPPAGYPFPYDGSPSGRTRNARLWERSWARKASSLTALLDTQLRKAGAPSGVGEIFLSGANYTCHETILQLGVPGFEYPRSDWPRGFHFAGLVQGTPRSQPQSQTPAIHPPFPWWAELIANSSLPPSERKKVVVVAQGTVEINPHDLLIPTMRAFSGPEHLDTVLVVAILGWKDADLATYNFVVPGNSRVADYLNYDAVLAHADVWVHNAGFGAVNHGIANGVPMVVAGEGMDKTDNARRVAWSGIGVDLQCAKPSDEAVKDGIERVLQDEQFTTRVQELRRESEEIDCFGIVQRELLRIMDTRPGIKQRGQS
ncbi:glycosyltransferase family 1 protein [Hypoxylon fragiforme]|uniref:glycosyltransferase family 1 protein n=1 Tax=Hypoxylon fragiforme TaxID=63214 RepID=UPI0020C6802C|nr:glycosyltransferase family 1 protein [Hypoxylon fragiforme]KAI2608921.1 glycosyltransferase family 1 protein [Hypoxylon fragiforme]